MNNQELISRHQAALTQNYGKLPAALVRGEGSRLWDADGKEYIDFFAGYGGTILGHAHPALVAAITSQAQTLWATGNQFYSEPQVRLGERLKAQAFDGRAFLCQSGAEANEAAIKLARLTAGGADAGGTGVGRYKIITMTKGFHGRTLGALSATPTAEYQKGFAPLVPGFVYIPYNDLPALEAAIDRETCGVMLEPIQGEGGINVPAEGYLRGVRALCDQHNLTLVFDEVWTGCGRTGKFFGHQWEGVTPDIMTLGKALGGGVPVGCMFAIPGKASFLRPGTHGSTLGGNPLCAAVSAAVLETIENENLPARAATLGDLTVSRLKSFKDPNRRIKAIRGRGLMLGIELTLPDGAPIVQQALALGLMINATQKNVLRLAPSLTISEQTLHAGLDLLEQALNAV
jgi:predicted acetylornithine/succinylornithine family transaminase